MFEINLTVAAESFSISNNLRLIVIGAIFIGFLIVFACLKIAKKGGRRKQNYMQKTNPYNGSSKSEELSEQKSYDMENTTESEIEKRPAINPGEVDTENIEAEIAAKLKTEINNVEADLSAKFGADIKDLEVEMATKLNVDISSMRKEIDVKIAEEKQKVLNEIDSVIDKKVEDALNSVNDRINQALRAQKISTASILEKMVDSLRSGDASVTETKPVVEKKPEIVESREASSETTVTPQAEDADADADAESVLPFQEYHEITEEKLKPDERNERGLETQDNTDDILGKLADSLHMNEESAQFATYDESEITEDEKEKEAANESRAESSVEAAKEATLEAGPPAEEIESSGKTKENVSDKSVEEAADFDINEFLNDVPFDISAPEEEDITADDEGKKTAPEEIDDEYLAIPEDIEEVATLEKKAPVKLSKLSEIEEGENPDVEEESDDFDVQAFLEELGNLPSEEDQESEKK